MNFVTATLHESKKTVVINMSHVMTMERKSDANGKYSDIVFVDGDVVWVDESPAELINTALLLN